MLGIGAELSERFRSQILRGVGGIKPGWVRVNFNYFISEAQFDFVLRAVELVAAHGWKLLPHYRFDLDAPFEALPPARFPQQMFLPIATVGLLR